MAVVAAVLLVAPTGSRAQERTACIERVISLDLDAKLNFQHGLHDLIVTNRPQFTELAGISRDLQVAMFRNSAAELAFLLRHDPDRIRTTAGMTAFSNFDWSDRDQASFVAESADHGAMVAEIERLRARNDGHPGWTGLRAYVRAELVSTPEFRALMDGLNEDMARTEDILANCGAP